MNTTIKEKVMKEKINNIISENLNQGRLKSITFLTEDLFELIQLTEEEKNREFLEFLNSLYDYDSDSRMGLVDNKIKELKSEK